MYYIHLYIFIQAIVQSSMPGNKKRLVICSKKLFCIGQQFMLQIVRLILSHSIYIPIFIEIYFVSLDNS